MEGVSCHCSCACNFEAFSSFFAKYVRSCSTFHELRHKLISGSGLVLRKENRTLKEEETLYVDTTLYLLTAYDLFS